MATIENYRIMARSRGDWRGVPVTAASAEELEGYERALLSSLCFAGDAIDEIDKVLSAHPDFIMGHVFRAAWMSQAMEPRLNREMAKSVAKLKALFQRANDRERQHIEALRCWMRGDFRKAVGCWENVVERYPRDLFALQLVHLSYVLLGDVVGQKRIVQRALPAWDESVVGYEFVLGFYAFGLLENREFMMADDLGRQAMALRPGHPYAIHAVAHVMEMTGRQRHGTALLRSQIDNWATTNFADHLWWHSALFQLDLGAHAKVLDIFDQHMRGQCASSTKLQELDAAALLWRLKLLNVDVGERWGELADRWEAAAQDNHYAFNDAHAMMTFASDNRFDAQRALLVSNERYLERAHGDNVEMCRTIGLPFCRAIQDFHYERYDQCVARLWPIRHKTQMIGGSSAQRDVVGWTLLEATIRAKNFDRALVLALERCARKATSPINWSYVAQALAGKGDIESAQRASDHVMALREDWPGDLSVHCEREDLVS